jgi:energy-coupling factor transport system permease protein
MTDDFELQRYITIGQYLPTGSVLHRLDPRTKVVGFGLLILAVAVSPSFLGLLVSLVAAAVLIQTARIRTGFALGGLRPALPVLLLLAVLQLVFGWTAQMSSSCQTLWSWWILHITDCSLIGVVNMLVRLTAIILFTSLLTLTTTISELTHGTENLLRPFQRIGLPAHELAMVFTLALRFVPTLAEELEKLLKAQAARGADIRLGSNPVTRTRHLLPVMVPLFITTLRRVEELTEAMLARGYMGGQGRTHYVNLKMTAKDWLALVCILAFSLVLFINPFRPLDSALWLGLFR